MFGSIVAAGLPLVIGVIAVVGTLLALQLISSATEVSIFALNLTTGLGLGSPSTTRCSSCRDIAKSSRRASRRVAIARSMQTAGRTVVLQRDHRA